MPAAVVAAALALAGCEDDTTPQHAPEATGATPPVAPPPPEGTLERVLYNKAARYADGLRALAAPLAGALQEGERRDHLLVLEYGRCYRAVGVGGAEVEDLDLLLLDPDNVQVQRDMAEDPYPVLGDTAEICPPAAGAYRLQVSMFRGHGRYLVGVYVLGE